MSNFRDYVTSTAFALTISHRQIQCMCSIHHGSYWALLTTFQALERKGLVERIKQEEQHKEGATIRLTDAGRACIPPGAGRPVC
jgi:DNA-binding HxlR family transcriptional regulator